MSQVSLNGEGRQGAAPVENGGQGTNGTHSTSPASGRVSDPALAHASPAQPHSQRIHAPVQGMQEADVLPGNARSANDAINREGAQLLKEQEAAAIAGAEEVLDAVFRDLQQADGKELERRDRLISRALSRLPDDAPQALVSGLATAQAHLCALSTGRSMLAEMQAKVQDLRSAAPENRPAMLEGMQSQWEALEMAEQELAAEEKTGTAAVRLFREDLAACRQRMAEMVGLAMEGLIPPGTNATVRQGLLSAPVCGAIAALKLRTGAPLEDIAKTIAQGMSAAQVVLSARDMEISLPAILESLAADTSPQNINAMVDFLFMDSYPGTMDTALLLKKALVPQNRQAMQGVELLHTLGAARRAIFQKLFAGEGQAPETSFSVRAFGLSFEQMKKLAGREGLRSMGYQIASLIALQVTACRSGLLDRVLLHLHKGKTDADLPVLREQAAEGVMRQAAGMVELGVARIVESLTAVDPASAEAKDIEQAMIEAARRFAMGLMGQTAEEKVGEAVARSAGALQSSMEAAAGDGFFLQGAENKAAALLDSLQVRITGIVDPEKRAVSGDPDGSKRRAMDGAMRMVFGSMFMNASAPGRGLLTGEGGLANDRAALQDALRRCGAKRAQVEKSALSMLRLAPLEERREALRAQLLAVRERSSSASIAAMKAAAKALGKAPSRLADAERLEAARNVRRIFYAQRRIGELTAALAGQDEPDPARMEELKNLHVEMEHLRRRLDGIDPATLLRTRPAVTHPSLAELSGSFEAARAVIYFAGEFRTKDKAEITRLEAEIRDLNKRIGTSLDEACALFGKDNVVRLNHAVAAAFMDVYVRSGAEAGDFRPHSADVLEQVRARLNEWGIPAGGGGLIEIMTQRAASRLSAPGGSLDVQAIDLAASLGVQDTAIQRAASQQALREQGSAVITGQTVQQRDRIAGQMAQRNREARLAHGLGSTLASLGRGEGFTFSTSRGLEIGLVANPDLSDIVDARIVALSPSVTVGALRENELSVHADGQGGYMVSMRTETTGSLGLGLEFDVGVFSIESPVEDVGFEAGLVNAKAEGKLELGSANGVMLHFSSAEDCSAFLTDFMSPGSSLRRKDGSGRGLWLTCDSLYTVEGGHVTKSFSFWGSLGGFEASTLYAKVSASGPSASLELSSTTRTSTEQNVHGYTEVKESSGTVSFSLAKGPTVSAELSIEPGVPGGLDLKGGSYETILSPFKENEYSWEPASVTFTSRTQRLYDGTIAGGSIACSMQKGERGAEEVLTALGLDMGQREGLQAPGGDRAAAIASAFDAAGEEDTVSVVWKLSAEGLARLRGLESSLRLARRSGGRAGGRTLAQLEAEYSRLLQDRSLYEPAEFAVESREKKSGSSLKVFGYSQSRSASNIGRVAVSLMPEEAA